MNKLGKVNVIFAIVILIGGCSTIQRDWKNASQRNNILAYQYFIEAHPNTEYVSQAQDKIQQIRFEKARDSKNQEENLKVFLNQYPSEKYSDEANKLLEEILYKKALSANSKSAYTEYISRYSQGSHFNDITTLLNKLKEAERSALTFGERLLADGLEMTEATILEAGFKKTAENMYTQSFAAPGDVRAPIGTTMHKYVVMALENSGQTIVPGCVAEMNIIGDRFLATVEHLSPQTYVTDRNYFLSPTGPPKGIPGGTIKIKYTSKDMNYEYYDSGNKMIISEQILRKSTKGQGDVLIEAVKKDGIYYLKSRSTAAGAVETRTK